ncbi:MAG: hypothetical protein SFV15_05450 [Polyangiaceae bacterium]|nr:hypothetical protein [Polyangiaceae bacterium]
MVENVQGSALDLPIIDANLRRRVKIEAIDIDVVDHETVGTNEIVRDRTLVKYCYVDPLYPKDNESDATECAGDEVQGRLEWACSLIPGSGGAVRLGITLSMYEGVTCSTKGSPDKTASAELIVQPCPPSGCGSGFDGPVSLVASDGANEVRVLVRASNELAP